MIPIPPDIKRRANTESALGQRHYVVSTPIQCPLKAECPKDFLKLQTKLIHISRIKEKNKLHPVIPCALRTSVWYHWIPQGLAKQEHPPCVPVSPVTVVPQQILSTHAQPGFGRRYCHKRLCKSLECGYLFK